MVIRKFLRRKDALDQFTIQQAIRKRAENQKAGRRFKRPPRWRDPRPVENEYVRLLTRLVREWRQLVARQVIPHIPSLVAEADLLRTDAHQDGWAENAENLSKSLFVGFEDAQSGIEFAQENIGQKTHQWNDKQWQGIMRSVVGVDLFQREPWLEGQLASWNAENTALITKLKDDTLEEVRSTMQRGIRTGQRAQTISKQIMSTSLPSGIFNKTLTRAKLIARDQVSKFNGELTHLRQTNLGIKKYIWRTSLDERVRSNHRSKEGKVFQWNKPPGDTGHPGNDYQCRCWPEPVFSDVEEEIAKHAKPLPFVNSPLLLKKPKTVKQVKTAKKKAQSKAQKAASAKTQGDILDNIVNEVAGTYTSSSAAKHAKKFGAGQKKASTKKRAKPNSKTTRPQDDFDVGKYEDFSPDTGRGRRLSREGEAYYLNNSKTTRKALTEKEHLAMNSYQSDEYEFINGFWRDGDDEGFDTIMGLSDRIDGVMAKSTLPDNVVVYRGLKYEKAIREGKKLPEFRRMQGLTYVDKSYMSTSISYNVASSWAPSSQDVVLKLYVDKGKKGFFMGNRVHREHEILLPRDTKVRITGVSELSGNRTLVEGVVE